MSFNDGFSIKAIPFPPGNIPSGSGLVYNGSQWITSPVITGVSVGTNLTSSTNNGNVTISLSQSISGLNKVSTTELTASRAYIMDDLIVNGTASIVELETRFQTSLVVGDKYITILSASTDHLSLDGDR